MRNAAQKLQPRIAQPRKSSNVIDDEGADHEEEGEEAATTVEYMSPASNPCGSASDLMTDDSSYYQSNGEVRDPVCCRLSYADHVCVGAACLLTFCIQGEEKPRSLVTRAPRPLTHNEKIKVVGKHLVPFDCFTCKMY